VAALPSVKTAGIATDVPLLGNPIFIMRFEGFPPVTPSQAPVANYFAITPGYFATMGMRLTHGRGISDRDSSDAPLVAVVNQTLVDRYFPGQNAVGKRLEIGFSVPPRWREIVGVVADVRSAGLDQDTPVQVYVAYYQQPTMIGFATPSPMTVLARAAGNPSALGAAMKNAILHVDRSQPVYAVQPMTDIISTNVAQRRFALILLAVFAGLAMFLAALGLYALMSYVVAQRTGEIGIRMALGAQPAQVLRLVQRQGMLLVVIGVAFGLGGGLLLTRLMTSMLFRVTPGDPLALIAGSATLVAVSLLASYLPARKAARVDPLVTLRGE